MTSAPTETQTWSRQRWWSAIALVLAIQTLLVFLLENRSPAVPRKAAAVPMIRLQESVSLEPLAVSDPTLFVLPHREGFSGEAWLNKIPSFPYHPADWNPPLRWLALSADTLGANFKEFITANASPPFQTLATIEPARNIPNLFPMDTTPAQSTLRIEGDFAKRRMLSTPKLQAWPNAELLTNSVVQLLVDAQGRTISAVLLHKSGSNEADASAMEIAKAAQFEPVKSGGSIPTTTDVRLTFEWQTLPIPATNAPAEIQ
jgi:TonB family protein